MEEKKKDPSIVKRNRNNKIRGHSYERLWCKYMRDLGYIHAKTSRQASRLLDNCKIDIAFVPFNIQCKNVKGSLNYIKIFDQIDEELSNNFPKDDKQHGLPTIIAHKRGNRKNEEFVVIKKDDFLELLKQKINGN